MDLLEQIQRRMHLEDHPPCPHCGHELDMTDSDRVVSHVTYWGEDEPVAADCPGCNVVIYVQEHVSRSWTIGRTPDEAADR